MTVEQPPPVIVKVAGPEGIRPLVRRLADAFARQAGQTPFELELETTNSGLALNRLQAGEIDFAVLALDNANAQLDVALLRQTPIARDGLAIIVHPDNPVTNLTLRDLGQLYSGKVFNWRDVQGSRNLNNFKGEVQTVTRADELGTRGLFQALILPEQRMTPTARVFPNDRAIINFVSQHPEAIGYVSTVLLSDATTAEKVAVVAVEEILPSQETLTNTAYPLTYPLYIITPTGPKPLITEFVAFILSPAGQSIITKHALGRVQ